jgi:hypothetical protein
MPSFGNPRTTFEITPLCASKYSIVRGVGGFLNCFLDWNWKYNRSPCKISEPYDNPFWDFSNGGKSKKINLPKIVAYLSCSAGRKYVYRKNEKLYRLIFKG